MAVRAAWGAPTCPRLRTRSRPTAVCSPCPGPVALGRRGFSSSSSVRRSSLPSPCSVPPRSFLVNSSAGRGRMLGCCRLCGDRAQAGRPPAADTGRGRVPTYVGTGLSCCRHCHLGLCHRRWTQVPRRLVQGELARRFLAGPPSSSSCAGGRRARTPHPAPDTPHLGDTPARRLLSLHITLGLRAELGGGGGRTPPPQQYG